MGIFKSLLSFAVSKTATSVAAKALMTYALFSSLFGPEPLIKENDEIEVFHDGIDVEMSETDLPLIAVKDSQRVWWDPIGDREWQFPNKPVSLSAGKRYRPGEWQKSLTKIQEKEENIKNVKNQIKPIARTEKETENLTSIAPLKVTVKDLEVEPKRTTKPKSSPIREETKPLSRRMRARLAERPDAHKLINDLKDDETTSLSKYTAKLIQEEFGNDELDDQVMDTVAPEILPDVNISGNIEMSEGLAFIGGRDEIFVYRELFGEMHEEGIVKVNQGFYKIDVEETKGTLVASMIDSDGRLKGQGRILLSSLKKEFSKEGRFNDIHLQIKPVVDGVDASVVSSYSFDKVDVPAKKAQAQFSGDEQTVDVSDRRFKVSGLDRGSSFQLRAQALGYWGTRAIGISGVNSRIELFPESQMDALLGQVGLNPADADKTVVVWGRVIDADGKNLEGAEVELASVDSEATYFNSLMLPDRNLGKTSANGLFVFAGVQPGIHQVRATVTGKTLPTEVFSADFREVSYVKIQKGNPAWVPMRVYDPILDESIPSELQVLGSNEPMEVEGDVLFELDQNNSVVWLESLPEVHRGLDYVPSRLAKPRNSDYLLVPGVSKELLSGIRKVKGLKEDGRPVIVGFIDGPEWLEQYQVYLGSDAKTENYQVVYFNQDGEISPAAENLGGFAIFGVEEGMQTVVVAPDAPLKPSTHLVIADSEIVSVVQHRF